MPEIFPISRPLELKDDPTDRSPKNREFTSFPCGLMVACPYNTHMAGESITKWFWCIHWYTKFASHYVACKILSPGSSCPTSSAIAATSTATIKACSCGCLRMLRTRHEWLACLSGAIADATSSTHLQIGLGRDGSPRIATHFGRSQVVRMNSFRTGTSVASHGPMVPGNLYYGKTRASSYIRHVIKLCLTEITECLCW